MFILIDTSSNLGIYKCTKSKMYEKQKHEKY